MACMRSLAHFLMTKYHNRNHWTIQSNSIPSIHPKTKSQEESVSSFSETLSQQPPATTTTSTTGVVTTPTPIVLLLPRIPVGMLRITLRYTSSYVGRNFGGSDFFENKRRNNLIKTLEFLTKSWSNIWLLTSAGDRQALHHFVLCKRIFRFYFATGKQLTIWWISV